MKIVNLVRYVDDAAKVASLRPVHRAFMERLRIDGRLAAGGPFDDGSGALFIYEVESLAAAERLVAEDPYTIGGAIQGHQLKPWQLVKSNPALLAS